MENDEKKAIKKELLKKISSKDSKTILQGLEELRYTGSTDMLPNIFQLLKNSANQEIEDIVYSFLCDLKEQSSVQCIMEEIENNDWTENQMKQILSACWQTGLDFSVYFEKFVDFVLAHNYETAFEAFTMIDILIPDMDRDCLDKEMMKLKRALSGQDKDKKNLVEQIIKLMD